MQLETAGTKKGVEMEGAVAMASSVEQTAESKGGLGGTENDIGDSGSNSRRDSN